MEKKLALYERLKQLIAGWESEVVEFKDVRDSYSTSDIGKYFSALANEANLRNVERGWLIFGVDDKHRSIVGSNYRNDPERLNRLKHQIAQQTEPPITLRDIHELKTDQGRVLMFEVPAAPLGIPIAWNGHYYARAGESLIPLGLDKLDEIRSQANSSDWTAQVIDGATLDHLSAEALLRAKDSFARKYANRIKPEEVNEWPLETFLERARLTRDGRITRATLLLLGKAEAGHLLSPHPAQLTWKLEGQERAYEHFGTPFLLNNAKCDF
jgi:ATP-dependent DNA helicase RecG